MADPWFNKRAHSSLPSNMLEENAVAREVMPFRLPDLAADRVDANEPAPPIQNTPLNLRIELGRTQLNPDDEVKLSTGAVVRLDKTTSDMVDVFVNGRLIARGEVVVVNDNLCVRVAEIVIPKAA